MRPRPPAWLMPYEGSTQSSTAQRSFAGRRRRIIAPTGLTASAVAAFSVDETDRDSHAAPGVYVTMNGSVFPGTGVVKDRKHGFVRTP